MREIKYICAKCGRESSSMKLLDYNNKASEEEKKQYPGVYKDRLKCKCGKVNTWAKMYEIYIK